MIAAAGTSGDALDGGGQIAITVRDHGGELVDLIGRFRRRLDFDPAPDAVENASGIERIGGGGCHRCVVIFKGESNYRHSGARASAKAGISLIIAGFPGCLVPRTIPE